MDMDEAVAPLPATGPAPLGVAKAGAGAWWLFALMALIWGLTWIAAKAALTGLPPLLFAGSRFVVAGVLLLGWLAVRGRLDAPAWAQMRRDGVAIAGIGLLIVAAAFGLLFWGLLTVPSGLAAVVNLALIPVWLLLLSLLHGEERFRWMFLWALALGLLGLAVLFQPALSEESAELRWGLLAVVGGTVAYAWGSVLNRPLLRRHPVVLLSALQSLAGGGALVLLAAVFEPMGPAVWAAFLDPVVLSGWLFMVLGGSLAAFTIYLHLVHVWSAARAGLYAFVSPVVALAAGALLYGEPLTPTSLAGSALMLVGAGVALRSR